jgi:type II secretory pathway pseudopilin PulG
LNAQRTGIDVKDKADGMSLDLVPYEHRRMALGNCGEDAQGTSPSLLPTADCKLPTGQEGVTLAALIVILTIISVVIAYTVPTQWSMVMKRERERQTIYLMKQYARGIANWQRKHQGLPVTLQQLQDARKPRMLRGDGKWALPLTGREEDWILVPPTALEAQAGGVVNQQGQNPAGGGIQFAPPSKLKPEASPKDYVGPFVAVRPGISGKSMLELNGATDYNQWIYTVQDLQNELLMLQMGLSQQ